MRLSTYFSNKNLCTADTRSHVQFQISKSYRSCRQGHTCELTLVHQFFSGMHSYMSQYDSKYDSVTTRMKAWQLKAHLWRKILDVKERTRKFLLPLPKLWAAWISPQSPQSLLALYPNQEAFVCKSEKLPVEQSVQANLKYIKYPYLNFPLH